MKALPEGLEVDRLGPSLAESWGLAPATIDYAPVGFGSYHWIVTDALDHRYYAASARAWLAEHARSLRRQLRLFDRLAESLAGLDLVVTHGEPHPGNVLRGHDSLLLIEWDTVALAPPERDLWMLVTADGDELAEYVDATGHRLSEDALSLYRLARHLGDVAAYLDLFRSPHESTEDNADAWRYLTASPWLDERPR